LNNKEKEKNAKVSVLHFVKVFKILDRIELRECTILLETIAKLGILDYSKNLSIDLMLFWKKSDRNDEVI